MRKHIACFALVVDDYDRAIDFYVNALGFELREDRLLGAVPGNAAKRWVVVAPPGSPDRAGVGLLLSRARDESQMRAVGQQAAGRVFLFLQTDDFQRDYAKMLQRGITFVRPPKLEKYGTVAVFEDLYGNLWDLIEFTPNSPISSGAA